VCPARGRGLRRLVVVERERAACGGHGDGDRADDNPRADRSTRRRRDERRCRDVGHHEGYDRVVFQFRDEGLPGYRVEYVQPPLIEDGSGDTVDVAGNAFVVVRMEPASGFDLNTGEGELVYKGPKRLPGTGVVKEVARTGDFEAVLSWAIGLEAKVPFRVTTAASPSRLIVDFKNS